MESKAMCLDFLEKQRTKAANGELYVNYFSVRTDVSDIKRAIIDSSSAEDAYIKISKILTDCDYSFDNIYYREDCYEYLIEMGLEKEEAMFLTKKIARGFCYHVNFQVESDKLPESFLQWTKGVRYLPRRKFFEEAFIPNTIHKTLIIKEFDDYYYKQLNKTLPQKIKNGEIEWIFSYGDKLISKGSKPVFNAVKKIVETKNCENSYIDSKILYSKCQELYEKYKNRKFWFSWFNN